MMTVSPTADFSCIPTNNDEGLKSGWKKYNNCMKMATQPRSDATVWMHWGGMRERLIVLNCTEIKQKILIYRNNNYAILELLKHWKHFSTG